MNVIKRKIYTLFHTPRIFMKKFESSFIFPILPDKLALKIQYKNRFLKNLDLENPKSFNEKLQWLKLYNRRLEYSTMVDKNAVKKYVASIIGEEYIIPTYGVWDNFDDINFDTLPNQFVLKCTHGSGDVVICKDKSQFDKKNARLKLNKSLKTNYYKISREWPYKNVKPQIIAEKLIGNGKDSLPDYKFMCFNGDVKCIFVCYGRFSKTGTHATLFDRGWNALPFELGYHNIENDVPKPQNYEKMITLSEKLSKNIPYVRVDFYEVDNQIYFGELTFFHGSGFEEITPIEWDYTLGSWIDLNTVQENEI